MYAAVVATYADGEELFKYGIYSKDVKFGYNAGPKLEYLRNMTVFRNGKWCIGEDTNPQYIDSNSAQKFEAGQELKDSPNGIFKSDIYFKVFDRNNKPTSNCILKMSLASGAQSSLIKETGCKPYPKLQILNYHRTGVVDETSISLDGNAFWVFWNDATMARPTGIDSAALGPDGAPSTTGPLKPAPIKNETESTPTETTSTNTPTSSAAAMSSYLNLGATVVLAASIIAVAGGGRVVHSVVHNFLI
ncbi:hypothetical protein Ndes2526B_g03665 [Nannochloris sp. 'desiccata']|nr:hypothetical protein KSW81_005467 [Chlorella desiccata (nom. nud.)]KAH7621326.1 hypothetical protein NADE_006591 [Chlorella desiccata (nom. nud.)]